MGKTSIAILSFLAVLSCTAWAQDASVLSEEPTTTKEQPAQAGESVSTPEDRQPMTDIHDIKPLVPVPVPVSWTIIMAWAGIFVAVVGLVLGGWFLWQKRRNRSLEEISAMLLPDETARQRLAALSAETGISGKAFYFQLSFIFREYLHGRFGIDGIEMTTEELLPHVETLALDRDLKRDSKKFIASCDPVKFAGVAPHQEAMERDFGFVKSFVEKTIPAVDSPANEKNTLPSGVSE